MSLRAWWPLIETTENKVGNIQMTNNNPIFNTNGKIGKCLETEAGTTATPDKSINLNIPQSIYDVHSVSNTEITYSLWIKIDKTALNNLISTLDFSTKTQIYNKIIGFSAGTTSNGLSIHIRTADGLTSSSQLTQVYIYGYLRTNGQAGGSDAVLIDLDKWYHVVISYDKNNNFSFYINGELIVSKVINRSSTVTDITSKKVKLNAPYCQLINSQTTTKHLLSLKEYFNDIRVYDHALSATEVHEIAQGLVRHYKLDEMPQSNLLTRNVNAAGSWTTSYCTLVKDEDALKITTTSSSNANFYQSVSNVWTPANLTYTISFDAKSNTNNLQIKAGRTSSSIDNITFTLNTEWQHYSGSFVNAQSTDSGSFNVTVINANANTIFRIKNIKLEYGEIDTGFSVPTIIIDNSGYNQHGAIVGTPTANSSPRYSKSLYMNNTGTTNHIECPLLPASTQTISFWCKSDIANNIFFADANTLMSFGLYKDGNNNWLAIVRAINTGKTRSISNYQANQWNHIVVIKDDMSSSTYKLYINGQEETTTSGNNYFSNTNTKMYLLNRTTNTTYAANASISDFRAYATVLSEEDILNLYKTAMYVDKNGNMLPFELIENTEIENINKSGQLNVKNIMENNFAIPCPDNIQFSPVGGGTQGLQIKSNRRFLYDIPRCLLPLQIHIHYKVTWSQLTKINENEEVTAQIELRFAKSINGTHWVAIVYTKDFSSYVQTSLSEGTFIEDDNITLFTDYFEGEQWLELEINGVIDHIQSSISGPEQCTLSEISITINNTPQAIISSDIIFVNELIER